MLHQASLTIGVLALATAGGLILSGMHPKCSGRTPDYLIVLGARVNGDRPGNILQSRIDGAVRYLKRHPHTMAVLSGGNPSNAAISEARCMRNAMIRKGISADRLILEDRSRNTEENLLYALMLIPDGATVGILTSDFHIFRTRCLAERMGQSSISLHAAPCPKRNLFLAIGREQLAVIYSFLMGKL